MYMHEVMLSTELSPDTYETDARTLSDDALLSDEMEWAGARITLYEGGHIFVDLSGEGITAEALMYEVDCMTAIYQDYAEHFGPLHLTWDELESQGEDAPSEVMDRFIGMNDEDDRDKTLAQHLGGTLEIPDHLEHYAGVIYEQMAHDCFVGGDVMDAGNTLWWTH